MSRRANATALGVRESEVDSLIATIPGTPEYASTIQNLRIEKTIIIAAKAIVEAIYGARY